MTLNFIKHLGCNHYKVIIGNIKNSNK